MMRVGGKRRLAPGHSPSTMENAGVTLIYRSALYDCVVSKWTSRSRVYLAREGLCSRISVLADLVVVNGGRIVASIISRGFSLLKPFSLSSF